MSPSDTDGGNDLVIVGAGPGGYTAAIRAAQLGLRPTLVEAEEHLGGVCLNWGCIPTKALLRQAEVYRLLRRAGDFGLRVDGEVGYDWGRLIGRSRQVAEELAGGVAALMKKNRVAVVHGRGRLTPARAVEVTPAGGGPGRVLKAAHVLLATGGRSRTLPGVVIDGQRVLSSREAMVLPERPESIAIVGAGAIGVEFASFFSAFGTQVTLLEAEDRVLPQEDPEVALVLARALERDGVQVHTGVKVTAVTVAARRKTVSLAIDGPEGARQVRADRALMAVGVEANTEGLGLEALGLRAERGRLRVNERFETGVKGLFAIGDLIGPPQLAHAASAEAVAAVEFIAGKRQKGVDPASIPSCTFSHPQVASVGLSEAEARRRGVDIKVGRFPFAASGRARASGETEGLVKIVFGARYGEVLGASIVGPEATELIAEVGLAIALEATWEELAHTVTAHPTLAEGVMEAAAAAFGEAINI